MQSNYVMTAKSLLTQIGSLAAATMVARSIINDFLPCEIRDYLSSTFHSISIRKFSSEIVMIIEEFDGLETNHIFESAELYIGARTTTSSSSATRFKVRKSEANKQIHVNLDQNEEVIDDFQGTNFRWVLHCHRVESYTTMKSEVRTFHLKFHKKFKNLALEKYLPHIVMEAELLKQKTKTIKLYTADAYGSWDDSIHLNHPSTFETLAMDTELKTIIIEDLERFKRRKEYYQRVGKAWKRGYLLYGPPGTGKSSLIAAMANYLNFDIYDLELNGLRSDLDLRRALVGTANKSIVVVEDIDCSVQFHDRDKPDDDVGGDNLGQQKKDKITLSGLLNFIDGLWSSCGDERIIIFTTNHKGKLDPALLRPGRMDLHIHMSYCTPCGFKLLANNYLGIKHHLLFQDIERLIEEALVTPAEVAEQLMRHDKADVALAGLVEFLNIKVDNAKNKATSESMFKEINDGSKDDVQVV